MSSSSNTPRCRRPAAFDASADLLRRPAIDPVTVGGEETESDAAHAIEHPLLHGFDDQRPVEHRPVVAPELVLIEPIPNALQRRPWQTGGVAPPRARELQPVLERIGHLKRGHLPVAQRLAHRTRLELLQVLAERYTARCTSRSRASRCSAYSLCCWSCV